MEHSRSMNEPEDLPTPPGAPARLVRWAHESIAAALGGAIAREPADPWCQQPAATFVTIYRDGRLHGCIGSLQATRALVDDVRRNALAAAFTDPRATVLRIDDLPLLRVEISHLSGLEPVAFASESELLVALRPGVDGVVLRYDAACSTLLPQVWEKIASRSEFLAELKMKAGLSRSFWSDRIEIHRYTVRRYVDSEDSVHD